MVIYTVLYSSVACCVQLLLLRRTNSVEQNIDLLGKIVYESTQFLLLTDITSLLTNHIWIICISEIPVVCLGWACKPFSLPKHSRGSWPTEHSASNPHQSPLPTALLTFSLQNLIPPQASSLSLLFSWYESQPTKPVVEKNDFLQINLISHVMLQVGRKSIAVILGALFSLPGSRGKVTRPCAGPHFGGPQSFVRSGLYRDGYCLSYMVFSELGTVCWFFCLPYRMMVCLSLLGSPPTPNRQPPS